MAMAMCLLGYVAPVGLNVCMFAKTHRSENVLFCSAASRHKGARAMCDMCASAMIQIPCDPCMIVIIFFINNLNYYYRHYNHDILWDDERERDSEKNNERRRRILYFRPKNEHNNCYILSVYIACNMEIEILLQHSCNLTQIIFFSFSGADTCTLSHCRRCFLLRIMMKRSVGVKTIENLRYFTQFLLYLAHDPVWISVSSKNTCSYRS